MSRPVSAQFSRSSTGLKLAQFGQGLRDLVRQGERLAAANVDHLLGDALLEVHAAPVQQLGPVAAVPVELHRAPDLRRVAADRRARLLEHSDEPARPLRVAPGRVPHVGVTGYEPDRGLPRRADPDRRVRLLHRLRVRDRVLHTVVAAVEVRALLRPEGLDDAQRLAEPADAMVQAFEPVHLVLDLGPGRADAELQATARQVIDGDRLLGQQGGVSIRVAGDQAADADALGRFGHRGLERPALVDRPVGAALPDGGEMVEVPNMVEARLVRYAPDGPQGLDGRVLSRELEAETQWMVHSQKATRRSESAGRGWPRGSGRKTPSASSRSPLSARGTWRCTCRRGRRARGR